MADDKDLIIDIPADDGIAPVQVEPKPEPVVVKTAPEPKTETTEDEAVKDLKNQVETLRTGKAKAEADAQRERDRAAKVSQDLVKARGDVVDTQANAIENAIAAAQAEGAAAVRDYQTAMETGDFAKAGEAQRKISRAEARAIRLEEAQADLEARKSAPQPEPEARRTEAPADPFETAIASLSPRSQTWLRQHKEFVTDPKLNMKANAAHLDAMAEGYIPDSDAYFDFCEGRLGLKAEAEPEPQDEPKPKPRTRTAMPAAPVSRNGASPTHGNLGANQIMLTPGEQRAATDGTVVHNYDDPNGKFKKGEPVGLREYARRKAAMNKDGLYDRSYTEQ